jgi:hypothetical protein
MEENQEIPLEKEVVNHFENEAYRNKMEFTVGYSKPEHKGEILVGFSKGSLAKGTLFVEKAD